MRQKTGGFLHPEKALEQLAILAGMKIADFGCGHGYFSIPLAKLVGAKGLIYALDVQKEALQAIKSKAAIDDLENIKTIHCDLERKSGSGLGSEALDMVFLVSILFQTQKKMGIIKEARRVLKNNGQLVIIDWLDDSPLAPKEGWLISKDKTIDLAEIEGFKLKKELIVDDYHFGLAFEKI